MTTTIDLFLSGDVMLGRGVDQIQRHPGSPVLYESHADSALAYVRLAETVHGHIPRRVRPDYVWGDALSILQTAEAAARIVNLETAITVRDTYEPKGINYRMHPGNVECLQVADIDCCVLANNHVMDWEEGGLRDTLTTLHRAGIATTGAGRDADEAGRPAELPLATGGRVLVIGIAMPDSGVPREWAACAGSPGVNLVSDASAEVAGRLAAGIGQHRRPGDLVIASIHWGENWGYEVTTPQREFAHALIDGGIDMVHGHSSHHPKGIEVYRNKLILYGCGDFINDYEGISGYENFRGDLAVMYLPRLRQADGRLVSLKLVPMRIARFRLNRPSSADTGWLFRTLARESGRFGTAMVLQDDGSFMIRGSEVSGCV